MPLKTLAHTRLFENAPFPECHASTVAQTRSGLVAAWFGGTHEKHPDVGIWLAHRGRNGRWSAPHRIAKLAEVAHWNPVLFADPRSGALHLWFKVGATIPPWVTWTQVSRDAGRTFSAARELVPGEAGVGGRGPVKNKPIVLSSGAWLAGASTELGAWECFVDRSEDGGQTWSRSAHFDRSALGPEGKCIQPTLWESSPGTVHALVRSNAGFVARTDSTDDGRTWRPLYRTELPHNNSGLDVARLGDGTLVLAYNPVAGSWGARSPLRLSVSRDNGATWTDHLDVETEPGGEFSYPALIPLEGRRLALTYTHKRRQIAFWMGEWKP